jgi:hypothetical protein
VVLFWEPRTRQAGGNVTLGTMAVDRPNRLNGDQPEKFPGGLEAQASDPDLTPVQHLTPLKRHVARLYGLGLRRREIATSLVDYLAPLHLGKNTTLEMRKQRARTKLRKWEQQQSFRDLVYRTAVLEIDLATPQIVKGVVNQAKRGKVDAAKFALELSGRYSPKGDQAPTNVAVVINGIPRPQVNTDYQAEIEVETEELED